MVEGLDGTFHALASAARRDMLVRLETDALTVGELAAPLAMSFAGASKHVRVLEHAGLVDRTVEGRQHRLRLAPAPLEPAGAWLARYERYWDHRLDALADLLRP